MRAGTNFHPHGKIALPLLPSLIQIDATVAHLVPEFVVGAHRFTIDLSVNTAIRLSKLRQPLCVR